MANPYPGFFVFPVHIVACHVDDIFFEVFVEEVIKQLVICPGAFRDDVPAALRKSRRVVVISFVMYYTSVCSVEMYFLLVRFSA